MIKIQVEDIKNAIKYLIHLQQCKEKINKSTEAKTPLSQCLRRKSKKHYNKMNQYVLKINQSTQSCLVYMMLATTGRIS